MTKEKCYIIAEAGGNHNGSLEMAKELVIKGKEAGADAVKFQTFKAEAVSSKFAIKAEYQIKNTGNEEETQLNMIRKFELTFGQHEELAKFSKSNGVTYLSSPFDIASVDFLKALGLPLLKIPSGEITNAPLLYQAAKTGLPLILSTGMANLDEIRMGLAVISYALNNENDPEGIRDFNEIIKRKSDFEDLKGKVSLLHCTTEYPCPKNAVNLLAMKTLFNEFGLTVGYSDHTEGIIVPALAVSSGAKIIEKHFTLDKNLPGPDHKASLDPKELKEMVSLIRETEIFMGKEEKVPGVEESKNIPIVRKSLVASKEIKKGEIFSNENVTTKRPGTGISAMKYWDFIGLEAGKDYSEDELIEG